MKFTLRAIGLMLLLLGTQVSWSVTVGLLVDEPSQQIEGFKQQLQTQLPSDTIQLLVPSQLNPAILQSTQKWVTLGPKSLSTLLSQGQFSAHQVLALFLPDGVRKQLRQQYPSGFTFLENDPSIARQLALIKVMVPQANQIGVYYSSTFEINQADYDALAKQFGLNLHWAQLKDPLDWDRNALKVLSNVDVVLGVGDNSLYNTTTIRSILMRLYRSGKALVGPDKGYVRAGAVASVYSGVNETLQATEFWIKQAPSNQTVLANPYFNVNVNLQVARSLNIVVEDEASLVKAIKERLNEK